MVPRTSFAMPSNPMLVESLDTAEEVGMKVGAIVGKGVGKAAKEGGKAGKKASQAAAKEGKAQMKKQKEKNAGKPQTQITNPMFNNELALADDDDDDDDDDDGAPPQKGELQADELSDLRATFEACDSDTSGGMDLGELTTVLKLWGVGQSTSIGLAVAEDPGTVAAELIMSAKQGYAKMGGSTKSEFQALVDSVGMPWDIDDPDVEDMELSFPEFMHMMVSGAVDKRVKDWKEGAFHMRLFKSGYTTADLDGDGELEKEELALAIGSLQSGKLSESEFDDIWAALNPTGKPFLTFTEFLDGMVTIKTDKSLGLSDKFNLTKPNQLMSLVMDTPVAAWEEKEILSSFDALEKVGMKVLDSNPGEMSTERKEALMRKANAGTIHELEPDQAKSLKALHHKNVMQAFVIGFLSCTVTSIVENFMTNIYTTDGIGDACDSCFVTCNEDTGFCDQVLEPGQVGERWWSGQTTCEDYGKPTMDGFACKSGYPMLNITHVNTDDEHMERVTMFWSFNGAALGICTCFEIMGLYYFGILNAVRVANMIDMRLVPMNRDRANVAQSLIRAALELGQSNVVALGIDPLREEAKKNKILNLAFTVLYMAKIFLTGFTMKVLLKRFFARGGAKYALPWMAVPATAAWNALVGNAIMREAKLRGLGVAIAVEMFNSIISESKDLDSHGAPNGRRILKLQILRAVACNIVKHRDFYPTKEVLLKHSMGYLGLLDEFKGTVGAEGGGATNLIDVPEDFVRDMAELNKEEQILVIKVLVLCSILDGRLRGRERKLYEQVLAASDPFIPNNQQRIKILAANYRNMVPVTMAAFDDIIESEELPATPMYYCNECISACALGLAC